jgi:EAL domain-containing protein (putative c-di-GMP-specific phosphodiesterase class I)
VRDGDLVARLAGDEFAVMVRGPVAVAEAIGARILTVLREPMIAAGREVFLQASIGVADDSLARSREPGDLLRDADLAMYLAKSSGKSQLTTYTAGVDRAVRERAELAHDIRQALALDQFAVHYQPVVIGATGQLLGVEALLRWEHPTRGPISPTEFIPIAEETGAIRAIGAWVLGTAATQVVAWQASVPGCEELELAVNLSAVQLADRKLDTVITATLLETGLAARHLTLEVTESMLLADVDLARHQLHSARALDVRVAIDDFGTGYCSLSYLATLPADQVKIDRSFVKDLTTDTRSAVLVKAIIDMATGLGLGTLAEGVENRGQQSVLTRLGCPLSQGFLFSPPVEADAFPAFAEAHSLRLSAAAFVQTN